VVIARQARRSHYRVLGLVGYGQFGRVYCAIHRKSGELVAIKDIHKDRFPTHKFLRELRFLISLEHRNIVTCHALEHSASGRQLVLDYCEAGTLRSILDSESPPTLEEVLGFLLDILAALDHAHQQGIVHCDIKPENILLQLTPGGWLARISDFGIARLRQETHETGTGQTGSPAYMAPERFYNQHSLASDLYAVGIILYELLLGKRPFSGTPMELMVAHLNQPVDIPDDLLPALQEIVAKSLQKLPVKRYRNAGEMRTALSQLYQQLDPPTLAAPCRVHGELPAVTPVVDQPSVAIPHLTSVMGMVSLPVATAEVGSQEPADRAASPTPPPLQLLLTCHQGNVWFYHWQGTAMETPQATRGFQLPGEVRQFVAIPQGGVLITPTSIHLLSMTHGLGCIAHCPNSLGATVAPNGRWFATGDRHPQTHQLTLVIRQLKIHPEQPVKICTLRRVAIPTHEEEFVTLLPLDNGHIAVVLRQRDRTLFHIATRRGNYLGVLSVQVPMAMLVPTSRPYRYLALEVGNPHAMLIVDLKPFRIIRHRVDVAPQCLFETAVGYGALSPDGDCSLINEEGQIISRMAGLPYPDAMVQISPTEFLWSVNADQASRLYTIDLASLGLDIIF
jgi:hypothetical protein